MSNQVLTLDDLARDTHARPYGVPVVWLGEDGDSLAAFTPDRRRALAAFRSSVRTEDGDRLVPSDVESVRSRWVLIYTDCGCEHADPHGCDPETNGPAATCCPVIPAAEDWPEAEIEEHNCPRYGLPPCFEDVYSWVAATVPEGTPGALHMFEVDR